MDQKRLKALLNDGLGANTGRWSRLTHAYAWIERAAKILRNEAAESGAEVRSRYAGVIGAMTREVSKGCAYAGELRHFLKVTQSYWDGLFFTYDVPHLPRTNNDLEHLFGSCRYHERRASGRRRGSEGLVVRGQVRILAAAATRLNAATVEQLIPKSIQKWNELRSRLRHRQYARTLGRRFRRDPNAYLANVETLMTTLPT